MWRDLRQLWLLLTKKQQRHLFLLQWLVLLMAVMETIGVASIIPFMSIVSDPALLQGDSSLATLYQNSNLSTPAAFLFRIGLFVLGLLTVSSVISMLTIWRLTHYAQHLGAELGMRLYRHYMHQPWEFHSTHHSATLTHLTSYECHRLMAQVIGPLLQMNARIATATLLLLTVFLVNPIAASIGSFVFILIYLLLFLTVRKHLSKSGKRATDTAKQKQKLMTEGFGGIKELLVLGRQQYFIDAFDNASLDLAQRQSQINSLAQLPRYLIELVAYGSVIMLVLYLLRSSAGGVEALLPTLALYALAGFKLLPAFQQIYTNLAQIRANIPALHAIREDLEKSAATADRTASLNTRMPLNREIALDNITYTYPNKTEPALRDLSLKIFSNQTVGIVGPSGAGKTSCIETLLGLLQPDKGFLSIDGTPMTEATIRRWQKNLGYVPQSIFLMDGSIRQNIAIGVSADEIDDARLQRAIATAHIQDIIEALPQGLNTPVGERGVRLSGGQRQRIGIARALYHSPEVIILDEATNALDTLGETRIMDSIYQLMHHKTIIVIAHRISTVQNCDIIYVLDKGTVVSSGAYSELYERCDLFRSLSKIS